MRKNNHGFAHVLILVAVLVIAVAGVAAWRVIATEKKSANTIDPGVTVESSENSVRWSMNGSEWEASGSPPNCSDPLSIATPVDISKATAILYPGQYRGSDYKPHGGFRFDGAANGDITVTVPQDSVVYKGSRYIQQGEVQYLFVLIAPCGIMYKFDHLLTLSEQFQALADKLPEAEVDNSATTNFEPAPKVSAGDVIATAVGFKKNNNVSVDFGVYDLRKKNSISNDSDWKEMHPNESEYGEHGICWLDFLENDASAVAKSLPGGDSQNSKTSDYCD